jgi:sugar transferase (PEP-CTERM/EpsH1 system associated)
MTQAPVLVVSPWVPYPPEWGGAITRSFEIVRRLAKEREVRLVCYGSEKDAANVQALQALGVSVRTVKRRTGPWTKRAGQMRSMLGSSSFAAAELRSRAMERAIQEEVDRLEPAGALVETSQLAAALRFPAGLRPVVDAHNLEFELRKRLSRVEARWARRTYNWIEYLKLRREEPALWARARAYAVTSEREAQIIASHAPSSRVVVVHNGVDVNHFGTFKGPGVDRDAIAFTGRLDYRPNADAAVYFAREVLPLVRALRPRAVFHVVGRYPPPEVCALAGDGVVVTGEVPDIRPYVARAAVVVVPLRAGSGTRLKILEALAMGKGLVSTPMGCEGLDLEPGRHLLVEEEPRRFAEAAVRVMNDPDLANRLGTAGFAEVQRTYDWPVTLEPLLQLFVRLERGDEESRRPAARNRPAPPATAAAEGAP